MSKERVVIKRDGTKVAFDIEKIKSAILRAFDEEHSKSDARSVADQVASNVEKSLPDSEVGVEQIQDVVEDYLCRLAPPEVSRAYIRYRYKRELLRQGNTTDKTIKELLDGDSEYWNSENSNKNPRVVTVQRDYLAGITSTDIARRFLFPQDVIAAHDRGAIHLHK